MGKSIKLVLVDNSFPCDSPFLLNKYLSLNELFNVKLIHWGKRKCDAKGLKTIKGPSLPVYILLILFLRLISHPIGFARFLYRGYKTIGIKILRKIYCDNAFIGLNADIIHFEFGTLAIDRMYLKDILRCKIVVSFRGYDINYYKLDKQDIYYEIWEKADAFHFLGNDIKNRAVKRGYKEDNRFFLISPAIDLDKFKKTIHPINKSQEVRIVSVGRLTWKKGYEYGLKAIQILVNEGFHIKYTIIGSGDYLQAIQFCIHELSLENIVELKGALSPNDIVKVLENSDLFLHPAVSEGFCNAVIEAQAMQLPVVCTKADGLSENIDENETGFSVEVYNSAALADKLKVLIPDDTLRKRFGENGRKRAEQHYSLPDQIQKYAAMYNAVMNLK